MVGFLDQFQIHLMCDSMKWATLRHFAFMVEGYFMWAVLTCAYNILASCLWPQHQGRQEDAEEFLGVILDSLHEEMVSALTVSSSSKLLCMCLSTYVHVCMHT